MNNYLADKESFSLGGGSEKENTSLLKNVITSGDEDKSGEDNSNNAVSIIHN